MVRWCLILSVMLSVSWGCGADAEQADMASGEVDAGEDLDADMVDASQMCNGEVITAQGCLRLPTRYEDIISSNKACEQDADCVLVGGANSCERSRVLGQPSGDAIHRAGQAQAFHLLCLFNLPVCQAQEALGKHVINVAPGRDMGCYQGRCVVENASCAGF